MAIRLADTARPNNYVDAEHKGTFPVAYADDVWFADGTRLSEKSFDGQSIQVEELPIASADELGNIYQYVGETGTYTNGYFYECVSDGGVTPTYSWKEVIGAGSVTIVDDFPTSNIENIIYRTQVSTFTVIFDQSDSQMILSKKGFTYTEDTVDVVFIREWTTDIETYVEIDSEYKRVNKIIYKFSPELKRYHKIMYNDEVLHEASESSGSRIFTFKTVSAYYAGDNINQKIERLAKYSDTPFTGTQAEWDALTIDEKLTYKQVNITDDESDTNVVVDAVTNGDMHAVTSNAVAEELKKVQSQTYTCSGLLINSSAGEISGYGRATVTLKDGVAEIKFSARIHTNTMTSTFSWGLNRDLLRNLIPDLPVINPINTNSNLLFFAANGTALVDLMGYGAMASGTNQFWIPARMYQINGGTGAWGSERFPVNSYITGTVYGIYTV